MASMIDELLKGLGDPVILFGHFTYFLLIVSMLMRRMVWLRSLAIASGLAKIIYRAFFVIDPVSVLWETAFVLVNIVQLVIIWYYEHHHRFGEDERHFVDNMPAGVERRALKKLLEFSKLRQVEPGVVLTREGEAVSDLMYVAAGMVQIETGGHIIAVCGPGDYLGEMSFLTGSHAAATATAVKPARVLAFDQRRLHAALDGDATLRRAMEAGLNRNLVGKLVRSNSTRSAAE